VKRALITGITGQDGSYLAELLLSKGYEVHGLVRRASQFNTHRLAHIYEDPHKSGRRLHLHYADLTEGASLTRAVLDTAPHEIYHLGAQSHVRVSFDMPEYTGETAGMSTIRLLEAIRMSRRPIRFYQASSSELYGDSAAPQSESTPFRPRSPYAIAKLYAYWACVNYREGHGIFASNGILFNHESPRRGPTFVSRKITMALAEIAAGRQKNLFLGNLDAKRDWGFAPEYVECMWRMLQVKKADDFVIGTGESHSVREFLKEAFEYLGMNYRKFVRIDKRYLRPTEVNALRAKATKAHAKLGWKPRVTFKTLVRIMVDADLQLAGVQAPGEGLAALKKAGISWTSGLMPSTVHAD